MHGIIEGRPGAMVAARLESIERQFDSVLHNQVEGGRALRRMHDAHRAEVERRLATLDTQLQQGERCVDARHQEEDPVYTQGLVSLSSAYGHLSALVGRVCHDVAGEVRSLSSWIREMIEQLFQKNDAAEVADEADEVRDWIPDVEARARRPAVVSKASALHAQQLEHAIGGAAGRCLVDCQRAEQRAHVCSPREVEKKSKASQARLANAHDALPCPLDCSDSQVDDERYGSWQPDRCFCSSTKQSHGQDSCSRCVSSTSAFGALAASPLVRAEVRRPVLRRRCAGRRRLKRKRCCAVSLHTCSLVALPWRRRAWRRKRGDSWTKTNMQGKVVAKQESMLVETMQVEPHGQAEAQAAEVQRGDVALDEMAKKSISESTGPTAAPLLAAGSRLASSGSSTSSSGSLSGRTSRSSSTSTSMSSSRSRGRSRRRRAPPPPRGPSQPPGDFSGFDRPRPSAARSATRRPRTKRETCRRKAQRAQSRQPPPPPPRRDQSVANEELCEMVPYNVEFTQVIAIVGGRRTSPSPSGGRSVEAVADSAHRTLEYSMGGLDRRRRRSDLSVLLRLLGRDGLQRADAHASADDPCAARCYGLNQVKFRRSEGCEQIV